MSDADPGDDARDHQPGTCDADRLAAAADHLSEALLAVERVDYNVPLEDELADLLAAKATLGDLCRELRQRQHSEQRREGEA